MRTASLALATLALLGCAETDPVAPDAGLPAEVAFAATTASSNSVSDFEGFTFVPCANGGAGEFVNLEGQLHTVTHLMQNDAGQLVAVFHVNPMGVRGVGDQSGDRFAGTGMYHERFTQRADGATLKSVNIFRMVGAGDAPSLNVHVLTRVAWEGGFVVTDVVLERITCR